MAFTGSQSAFSSVKPLFSMTIKLRSFDLNLVKDSSPVEPVEVPDPVEPDPVVPDPVEPELLEPNPEEFDPVEPIEPKLVEPEP